MATLDRLRLAAELPDLGALGVEDAAPLLAGEPGARAELVCDERGLRRLRLALPGTPGPDGRVCGAPRGAGTGWVVLSSWREPPLGELLAGRFRAPRSASLAERAWNLLCHLRAAGVGTPEPLAVGARGRGLVARRSFLVTRELRGFVPLASFAAALAGARDERAAARAAATFLARLLRARYVAPPLSGEVLRVRAEPPELPGTGEAVHACEADALALRRNRLPGFALADVRGGRVTRRFRPRAVARMLSGLAPELAAAGVRAELLAAVLRGALRGGLARDERRALLRALRGLRPA